MTSSGTNPSTIQPFFHQKYNSSVSFFPCLSYQLPAVVTFPLGQDGRNFSPHSMMVQNSSFGPPKVRAKSYTTQIS
jgi:hypothetical protein